MNNELRTQLLALAAEWRQSAQSKITTAEKLYSKTSDEPDEFAYRSLYLAAKRRYMKMFDTPKKTYREFELFGREIQIFTTNVAYQRKAKQRYFHFFWDKRYNEISRISVRFLFWQINIEPTEGERKKIKDFEVTGLTEKGHDFLSVIKDDKSWAVMKTILEQNTTDEKSLDCIIKESMIDFKTRSTV